MPLKSMKIGAELELPDIRTDTILPCELGMYDFEEMTIINTCGIANDPLKQDILVGSEINMTPVTRVQYMVNNIERVYDLFSPGTTNYNAAFHVHLSLPGLAYDFDKLKKLHIYTFYYAAEIYRRTNPITIVPNEPLFDEHLREILHINQYEFPIQRKKYILESTSWEEFRDRQQPMKGNRRLTHLIRRCAINIRSLWDNGTVEFRHFWGTDNLATYESVIEWCILYLENALGAQKPVEELFKSREWKFPPPPPWSKEQYTGWKQTNYKYNSRKEVRKKLYKMVAEGLIPAEYVGEKVLRYKD